MSSWKNENWWVSPYNVKEAVTKSFNIRDDFKIHDATLRDGEQTPGVVFRKEEKIKIAHMLAEAGVHRIEAGMPAVSQDDREAIMEIKKAGLNSEIFAFVRAREEDILMCKEAGVDGVIIELPIGKPKLEMQFGWDVERIIDISITAIKKTKELGMYAVFFPYDTTRADESDLEKLLDAVVAEALPDSIGIVDTMGCALPGGMRVLTDIIRGKCDLPIEVHTHNDFGLALANTLEAITYGANVAHGCINGMGERTGNCAVEEIAVALQMLYGVDTGIDVKKLLAASKYVEEVSGFKLAKNKPIIGTANYTRESGIGINCLYDAPLAMFATNPAYFGRTATIVLGKKSGKKSIEYKLNDLGLSVEEGAYDNLLADVKALGILNKRNVTDQEFINLVKKYQ